MTAEAMETTVQQPPSPSAADIAFTTFWAGESDALYRWARKRLRREEIPDGWLAADDVVQHVAAVLLERWPEITASPRGYAYQTAKNFIGSNGREQRRYAGDPDAILEAEADRPGTARWASSPRPQPVDLLLVVAEDDRAVRQQLDALPTALTQLPERQRRLMVGCLGERRPRAEIAEELGMGVGTISPHLDRGKKALKKSLAALLAAFATLSIPVLVKVLNDFFSSGGGSWPVTGPPIGLPHIDWPDVPWPDAVPEPVKTGFAIFGLVMFLLVFLLRTTGTHRPWSPPD